LQFTELGAADPPVANYRSQRHSRASRAITTPFLRGAAHAGECIILSAAVPTRV